MNDNPACQPLGPECGAVVPPLQVGEPAQKRSLRALVWRGDESKVIRRAGQVRPGDTIVLPVSAGGWEELGHVPEDAAKDVADRAAFDVRLSVSLRLHPEVMKEWPQASTLRAVADYAGQDAAEPDEMNARLTAYFAEIETGAARPWPHALLDRFQRGELRTRLITYPGNRPAYVLEGRKITHSSRQRSERVLLEDHLKDVAAEAEKLGARLGERFKQPLKVAAIFHDYGKLDVRYQAWLLGGDLMAAQYAPKPVAKSGLDPVGKQTGVGLPEGFRHELLSLMFAEKSPDTVGEARDLILHLVASHHGRCRPFAPVISDEDPHCVSYGRISVCRQERLEQAPHRLDSEVAERFWKLTRKNGWWGLAYLEALLRLADWKASEEEDAEVSG